MTKPDDPAAPRKPRHFDVAIHESIAAPGFVAGISLRTSFSRWHLYAARRERDLAVSTLPSLQLEEHRAHVVLCVMSSACFLEALVHEVILDAHEKGHTYPSMRGLTEPEVKAIAKLEPKLQRNGSCLPLFHEVLDVAGRPAFELTHAPWEPVESLFHLRNALVHARPADTALGGKLGTHHPRPRDVTKRLLEYGFDLNPHFEGTGNGDWPDRIIGSGCARWAVAAAEACAAELTRRLGIPYAL